MFESIIQIETFDRSGNKRKSSGFIVNNSHIITAAHCVFGYNRIYAIVNNRKVFIHKTVIHKNFRYYDYGSYDIALCWSSNNFNLQTYPQLSKCSSFSNQDVLICGFDCSSDNLIKMKTKIKDFEKTIFTCDAEINQGLSGGPVISENNVIGINSFRIDGEKSYSCHTDIGKVTGWIEENSIL